MTKLPARLHHTAYVTKDQEKTRQFYEDVIGLPLTATWCESDMLFGKERTYVHTFYGIGDGGALAFFSSPMPMTRPSSGRRYRSRRSITSHCRSMRRPRRASKSASPRRASSRRRPTCSNTATAARST